MTTKKWTASSLRSEQDEDEIRNSVRVMAGYFGRIDEKRMSAYARDLRNFPLEAIKKSCREIVDTQTKFPSLAELKALIRSNMKKVDIDQAEFEAEFAKEQKRLDEINKKLNFTDEQKVKWIKAYCLKVFGPEFFGNLEKTDLTLMAFEKPAIFSLAESNMNAEKAIEIGKRKLKDVCKN